MTGKVHALRVILPFLLGLAILISIAACAPSQTSTAAPTATITRATPTATPVPRLVYQANWSHGIGGWKGTPGWTVAGGMLLSDVGEDRTITSPFQPTSPNYAVEFRLQIVSLAPTASTQYAFSADPSARVDGYEMLVEHISPSKDRLFPNHPHEMIFINPMIDQQQTSDSVHTLQIHDFEPGTVWRTYRVEVQGPYVRLYIDGRTASWAQSAKSSQLSFGALHLYTTGVAVRISDFSVYAL